MVPRRQLRHDPTVIRMGPPPGCRAFVQGDRPAHRTGRRQSRHRRSRCRAPAWVFSRCSHANVPPRAAGPNVAPAGGGAPESDRLAVYETVGWARKRLKGTRSRLERRSHGQPSFLLLDGSRRASRPSVPRRTPWHSRCSDSGTYRRIVSWPTAPNRVSERVRESPRGPRSRSGARDSVSRRHLLQQDHTTRPLPRGGWQGRGRGFLFDLDVAILAPLDVPDRASVWGKIVRTTPIPPWTSSNGGVPHRGRPPAGRPALRLVAPAGATPWQPTSTGGCCTFR